MSNFTQNAAKTMNMGNAAMVAAMAMMPNAQTCQKYQQASQPQQTQRQSQNMRAHTISFTQAENNPVFCFFYSYQSISTPFTNRPEEILNHARQGGARI
jgi:hypothetical protein